jgi:uncharacterized OsmC-like protein
MGIEMGVIEMRVEGDLDPTAFQGADTDARPGYQTVRVELAPESDADQATLEEWLTTVEARCPVSDNVGNATPLSLSVSA